MASGQAADYGQQALAAEKLLSEKDLCFRVGGKAAGEKRFSGAARRYAGKILEIRHISSCGHGSCKRPLELKALLGLFACAYSALSWVLQKTP